ILVIHNLTFFFFQAEDGIRDRNVTGVQTCALPILINPATPAELIRDILPDVDLVLLMTVNPGFGGQSFIHSVLPKIEQIASWRDEWGLSFEIEVDGGVNEGTIKACVDAGADVLVAGSAIFNSSDRRKAVAKLHRAVSEG